jgi:hypothetical protein
VPPTSPDPAPFAVRRRASTTVLRPLRGGNGYQYSRDQILAAIRDWATRYGEPPSGCDWEPARARRQGQDWRADRYEGGDWPSARMVRAQFGTFNGAIVAAGLTPRRAPTRLRANLTEPGAVLEAVLEWTRRYGSVPTMADWDPVRARRLNQDWRIARYNQGDWPSARTVARHFGSVSHAIKEAGLLPRPRSSRRSDRQEAEAANRHSVAKILATKRNGGVKDFAACLSALAAARAEEDPVAIHAALIDTAASAVAWAQVVGLDA